MNDFIAQFNRRKKEALTVALLVFLLGAVITYLLPATYRSTATVLIENNQPELGIIGNGVGGYADRRIKLISKRVLSSKSLSALAKELALFPPESFDSQAKLNSQALAALRNRIDIELIKVKGVDPKTRFPVESAIAFDLSFTAKTAEEAQRTAQRLAELFLQQNEATALKSSTDDFLDSRLAELQEKIDRSEDKLKEFKSQTVYSLPEMREANLRILEKTQDDLSDARLQLRALKEEKVYLESELLRLKPYAVAYDADGNRILGPEDQLKALQSELAEKRAKYSPLHPDILKLEGEIANLSAIIRGDTSGVARLNAQVEELLAEQARLRQRYSSDHPSTKALDSQIAGLQKQLQEERENLPIFTHQARPRENADNPAYIATAGKLKSVQLEIAEQKALIANLQKKYDTYEQRVEASPNVEREYNELLRQHEQALNEFNTLSQKSFSADLSGSLERSNQQQELVLLEEANTPEDPYKPNRKLLLMLSAILALLSGIATVLFREHLDDRVWTAGEVEDILGEAPLVSIPEYNVSRPIRLTFLSDVLKKQRTHKKNKKVVSHA